MKAIIISIGLFLTACLTSSAVTLGGPVLNPANNHYYFLLSPATWSASQAEALTLGGNLVTINDAAENQWVYSTFGGLNKALWLGLTDQAVEGDFRWISGESISYNNWSPGEPNSGGGFVPDEDYAYMVEANPGWPLTPGAWNDVPNNGEGILNPVYGVVEVPEPSTAGLGLVALGALLQFRRRTSVL